ncbi:response regulator transcription factor [Calothrix sp. 336/3]|uniref:response regulator transcription factor n=1 Tax=Calothrix sp. 336/3 TaxID=1337936 RepID=UPI0004E32761|nr:response regulator transcription factor [Calothrix sp. 336/3]AKG22199.1 GlcNAc transferase [Calothrix sp. 336/3]
MRILLIEDDIRLAETLAEALTDQLYVVDVVHDGEAGWNQVKVLNYDLLLLDVMLPELDGMSLCHRLRSHGYNLPILMLTACDTIHDEINGLDVGADDYIVKPVDLQKLFARIRALLRRGSVASPPILEWGELRLNPSTYEVSYGQTPIHLTPKEYALLELLLRNGRRVLSRRVMIEHVWALESPPEEHAVKVHIRSLRQKLKAVGAPEDFIETVHSMGYRLNQNNYQLSST